MDGIPLNCITGGTSDTYDRITCWHNSGASIGYSVSMYPHDGLTPLVAVTVATKIQSYAREASEVLR